MSQASYASLPFREQIEFFRRKLNLPTQSWTDIYTSEHDWAFVVAGANRDAIVADFRAAVDKAIAQGTTLEAFRKDFDTIVAKHGWDYNGGRSWRSRVIYDTNLSTSYAAGRWEQLQNAPYWQYEHQDWVQHPRPLHVSWDGLVLERGDPWWETHYPPNGWGCHCTVRGLWPRDLQRLGKSGPDRAPEVKHVEHTIGQRSALGPRVVNVPEGIDPGFEYAPGSTAQRAAARRAMTPQAAPAPTARPWQINTPEGDWHDAAFGKSPKWLQNQVGQRGPLRGGITSNADEGSLYHISGDRLNLNPALHADRNSLLAQSLWRHEYGHAMDSALGNGFTRSSEMDFGVAMRADAVDLITMGGHGKPGDRTLAALARLAAAESQSAQELATATSPTLWLRSRYGAQGLDFALVQNAMQAHSHFAASLSGSELNDRYRRIIVALEMRDAEGLIAAITGGMDIAHMNERRLTYRKGNVGNLSDLFGSATNTRVAGLRSGFGHPQAYYDEAPSELPQAESFANITSLIGDENTVWTCILEIMVPRMTQLYREIMK